MDRTPPPTGGWRSISRQQPQLTRVGANNLPDDCNGMGIAERQGENRGFVSGDRNNHTEFFFKGHT